MRMILILLGIWVINQFSWILYIFGVFLIITAIKMLFFAGEKPDLDKNIVLKWMRKHLRITENYHAEKFFVKINQTRYVTPLFLVLILIEISDLIFAIDSVPTIFAITSDPFIVLTSNIFAILGLRALYFLLANSVERFHLLKYGLAIILIFIGTKMLIAAWFKIPVLVTLSVILVILISSILLSLYVTRKPKSHAKI
jgi:tellurite resistance protein TerC